MEHLYRAEIAAKQVQPSRGQSLQEPSLLGGFALVGGSVEANAVMCAILLALPEFERLRADSNPAPEGRGRIGDEQGKRYQ
jgi:hypothetical protein